MPLSFDLIARKRNAIFRRLTSIAIIALGIVLDVVSKKLAIEHLKGAEDIDLIPGILRLSYLENRGAAWGMFADQRWVFMSISTVTIIVILGMIFSGFCRSKVMEFSLAAILAGGIGNMIDRTSLGYVVDMIEFYLFDFPVFNVADCFVTLGTAILMIAMVVEIVREERIARRDAEYDQLLHELEARGEFDEEENEAFFDNLRLDGVEEKYLEFYSAESAEKLIERLGEGEDFEGDYHAHRVTLEESRRNLTDSLIEDEEATEEDELDSEEPLADDSDEAPSADEEWVI